MGNTKKLIFITIILLFSTSQLALAGFLDKLNQASAKLNQMSEQMDQKTQQMQQAQQMQQQAQQAQGASKNFELTKTDNPIKGTWGGQVTCAGPNSATCANGLDDYANCMHQTKGYYYRLVAEVLENKLKNNNLSDEERKNLEADIVSVKAAIETGNVVDPDPQNPQRWFKKLTKEDQKSINGTNGKYMKEVHDDCEARFGGMARYSSKH